MAGASLPSSKESWANLDWNDFNQKHHHDVEGAMDDLIARGLCKKKEYKRDIVKGITEIFIAIISGFVYLLTFCCWTQAGEFAWNRMKKGTNLIYPPTTYIFYPNPKLTPAV